MSTLGLDRSETEATELEAIGKKANNIFIASIISVLFCCLGGCLATYFSYQAKQDADAGNLHEAQRKLNIATGWMIATYVLGVLSILGKIAGR
jgi:hypothetical protein